MSVPDGLMFYRRCFSPRVLLGPSTDRPETLPQNRKLAEFYNPSPKVRASPKNWVQNMQNFGQFCTTSEFDREYLRNEATYPKSENNTTREIPTAFNEKRR